MRMTKRRWGVAILAGGVVLLTGWALRPKPVDVDVTKVIRGPLTVSITEDAVTRVRERYDVAAPVAGRLLRVVVHAGDEVRPDAPLARIEVAPLDPKSEAQLTARLRAAEQTARESEAMVRRAHEAHGRAATEARRLRELAAQSIVSRDQLDAATSAESIAAREVQAARFRAEAARYEVAVARAAVGGGAEHGEVVVRAPVSGRVLQVLRESESIVAAGTPIISIGDAADLEIVADYLSTDAVKLRPGDRMLVEQWGGPRPLAARVRVIEPSAFTKISALGVEEQRVNVIGDFTEPAPRLGDHYRVDARAIVWQGEALKAPATAVFTLHGAPHVFAVRDKRARLQKVEVGHIGETEVEIVRGLAAGDVIVLHPSDQVRDGVRVR